MQQTGRPANREPGNYKHVIESLGVVNDETELKPKKKKKQMNHLEDVSEYGTARHNSIYIYVNVKVKAR